MVNLFLIMSFFIIILIGYLLGSINTTVIIGKIYGVDVKKEGSGNAGMTNAMRVLGKKAGLWVILGDILKGVAACLIGYYIMELGYKDTYLLTYGKLAGGFSAVLGHVFPIYFKFKGGKGVLTSFAVLLTVSPIPALICLGIFIIVVLITKYVSLGSIISVFCFPFIAYWRLLKEKFFEPKNMIYFISLLCFSALVIIMHRSNISRLIKGNENKVRIGKSKKYGG